MSTRREPVMSAVEKLMLEAFGRPRDPRSAEYKAGCRALLERKIDGAPLKCPHPLGTAQSDAWFAGTDEGHLVYRKYAEP